MHPEEFLKASLKDLERHTGIDDTRWCKYLSGKKTMHESTIAAAAKALCMNRDEFYKVLLIRRQKLPK